jgi:hypothetical protein
MDSKNFTPIFSKENKLAEIEKEFDKLQLSEEQNLLIQKNLSEINKIIADSSGLHAYIPFHLIDVEAQDYTAIEKSKIRAIIINQILDAGWKIELAPVTGDRYVMV